ncbi:MAG: aminotransferase class I/II-fold pyridoxal phosphate-dependent enzyme [Desulfobacterales bacterium]
MKKEAKETQVVHGIHTGDTNTLDLVAPIHMTSAFEFKNAAHGAGLFSGKDDGYIYTRISNPTVSMFQAKMAILEGGEDAIATSSGMSAIASIALSLAKPGDNFVSCATVYGGTFALFTENLKALQIEARLISPALSDSKKAIESLVDKKTRFLYMETPANPTLDVIDIEMWAGIARKHLIPLVVDNTFATAYLQNPLLIGADVVVHSATKYISGHADVIGGVIVGKKKMMDRIRAEYIHHFGPTMSPFNAWLFLRGIKTLAVRMERHCLNAMRVAEWLNSHPKVTKVYYPGLPSHPGHPIAKKQMKCFGGMIAFEVSGGIKAGQAVMDNVHICRLAVSLGDCDTLIQHPASMTHSTYTKEDRTAAGIPDGLIRISVGIEHADDIIKDLENSFSFIA